MCARTWFWAHQGKRGLRRQTVYDMRSFVILPDSVYENCKTKCTIASQLLREGSDAYDYLLRLLGQVEY